MKVKLSVVAHKKKQASYIICNCLKEKANLQGQIKINL